MISEIFARNVHGMTEKLQSKTVGIAGCGGLGSNIAVSLVRAGIGRLILADFDIVEASNLNRQHYFQKDIGRVKVEALREHLQAIHSYTKIHIHHLRLVPENIPVLFQEADLLIEAFDIAESKQWLIETWVSAFPEKPIIVGSGLAGAGRTNDLKVKKNGNIYLCGDGESEMDMGLCSARVCLAANMQANAAIALLIGMEKI